MLTKKQMNEIEKFALSYYKKLKFPHGVFHSNVTLKLAMHIAKREKADLSIVRAGALLHQIHNKATVSKFLKKINVEKKLRERIEECVWKYRADNFKKKRSLEANVVYDADTL